MPRIWTAAIVPVLFLCVGGRAFGQYPTHAQIGTRLANLETTYPAIVKFYNLGVSTQNRALWAVRITDNVQAQEDEPEVRYISTMHGDEVTGVEMCLRLADYLTTNYGSVPRVTSFVDNIDLWIMPLMNPDGYVAVTRENSAGVDLNRNFPSYGEANSAVGKAPETAIVMNWTAAHHFILSANFHGGALVVNYPFDNDLPPTGRYSQDEALFNWMSEEYSKANPPMWASSSFFHGVTNGADWYVVTGSMQDWDYHFHGGAHFTIEIGNTKTPAYSTMNTYWNENRDAMLNYAETSLIGVRGLVTDAVSGAPLSAEVKVVGRELHTAHVDPTIGDYHRLLRPGTYTLNVTADGYYTETIPNVLVSPGAATRVDVAFQPAPAVLTDALPEATSNVAYPDQQLSALGGKAPLDWGLAAAVSYAEGVLPGSSFVAAGTARGWHGNDAYFAYPLPFAFPYYGTSYTSVRINANGFIDFGQHTGSTFNNTSNLLISNRMIAPLWDDLTTTGAYDIYIDASVADQVTIRWEARTVAGTNNAVNFSATLFASGAIRFDYGSGNAGITPTVGISNGDGLAYTLSAHNGATLLTDAASVRFAQGSSLPTGMSFSASGVLSGTPRETGTFNVAVKVTDDIGRSAQRTLVLTVTGSNADGDADGDGDVDLLDFGAFQRCFGTTPAGDCADVFDFVFDGDQIDLIDFDALAPRLEGPAGE